MIQTAKLTWEEDAAILLMKSHYSNSLDLKSQDFICGGYNYFR